MRWYNYIIMKLEKSKHKKESGGKFLYAKLQKSSTPPSIVVFLVKNQIVKTEASARRLWLFLIIVIFLISFALIIKCVNNPVFIDRIK